MERLSRRHRVTARDNEPTTLLLGVGIVLAELGEASETAVVSLDVSVALARMPVHSHSRHEILAPAVRTRWSIEHRESDRRYRDKRSLVGAKP